MTLGQDFEQDAMDAFSGELYDATLTRQADTPPDPDDPTGAPSSSPVAHPCEAYPFTYQQRDIDGTRVVKGDFRVVILRGSIDVEPIPGDSISIPPPGSTTPAPATVVRLEAATEAAYTVQVRG